MTDEQPGELNLTPYLDVLMNLIVFVLVSGAGLLSRGALPVKVPGHTGGEAAAVAPRLRLEPGGMSLSLGGEAPAPVSADELFARLSASSGRALTIEASPAVTLEQLVAAMDTARKAHFDEVTLAD